MITYPKAKINLGLNVVAKRPDGYHDLETVFLPIDITDELEINVLSGEDRVGDPDTYDSSVRLTVVGVDNLCDIQHNLVYKAYKLLAAKYQLPPVTIRLKKNIPSQAGMGGGSSDAAYTLVMLNQIFNLNLPAEELEKEAARLGADCALFVKSCPAYATGIGDILTTIEPLECLKGKTLLLVKPNVAVSTKEAYENITPRKPKMNCLDVLNMPIETWKDNLTNDFEDGVFSKHPILRQVKEAMYDDGAIYAAMSGSGSTIFGIFESDNFKLNSPLLKNASKYFTKTITL